MRVLKLLCAAFAAVTTAFTAEAAKTAKAVVKDGGATLRFVYDETNYGTKDTDWFLVAEAEAQDPNDNPPWHGTRSTVTKVVFDESFAAYRPTQCGRWFYEFEHLSMIENIGNLDTSVATSFAFMFGNCSSLTMLDLSDFDTANVTNMSCMFYGCSELTALDVSGFDTSKVTDMSYMFNGCSALKSLNLSGFDTSNVTNMNSMFYDCSELTALDVSGFDTSKVTKMGGMFYGCSKLTALDVTGFDTAKVTTMAGMFSGCSSLTSLDIAGFDTSKVTYMWNMFSDCSSLTSLNLSGFNTSQVTEMEEMFFGCSVLGTIVVSDKFVTTAVLYSWNMFDGCSALVGGKGTSYDSSKTDKTYARIDGGLSAPGYFTLNAAPSGGYAAWAAAKGLTGADAAWDAKPAMWGGTWENGFIYTFGEGLAGGSLAIMGISFDADGEPVITTTPVVEGHTDFTPAVIGTPNLRNWSSPVVLENKSGDDWTLPAGKTANFFRVRLSE